MDWNMVLNNMPLYLEGAWTSLSISVMAIIGSTIVGYFIAILRLSSNKILNGIAGVYVWIARGTPLMLILFWLYYTTPFGLTLDAFTAGMVAMIINSAPFKSEIIRGGLVAVDKKQLEAADAVGMNPIQKTFRITIPATIRLILPSYMSNCVSKSTLLRCINLLEVPTSGEIFVDGYPLRYKKNKLGNLTLGSKMEITWLRKKLEWCFNSLIYGLIKNFYKILQKA